jgi:hypothetical protein
METIKLSKLKNNEKNPRRITKARLEELKRDIEYYPDGLALQPIVVEDYKTWTVISGNQRLKALKALGYKEIPANWVVSAEGADEEQKEFVTVKFNDHAGFWDNEGLQDHYGDKAEEWLTDRLPEWEEEESKPLDFSDKNKEIDIDSLDDEMVIKLKYPEDEYWQIKGQLSKIAQTPEQAVWKLLGNE